MEQDNSNDRKEVPADPDSNKPAMHIDPLSIPNAVLQRLLAEVRYDRGEGNKIAGYNRSHNRHNRSK
jgi:hypothetical protein